MENDMQQNIRQPIPMQERIDLLIKARREHPENISVWNFMYSLLKKVPMPAEMKQEIVAKWEEEDLREQLISWDDKFTEALITGKVPDEQKTNPEPTQQATMNELLLDYLRTEEYNKLQQQQMEMERLRRQYQSTPYNNQFVTYENYYA